MRPTILALMVMLLLLGCGGSDQEINNAHINVPIRATEERYIEIPVSVDGQRFVCLFDTGAPGLWLPANSNISEWSNVLVEAGNWSNIMIVWLLEPDYDWTGCLIGMPFFNGLTNIEIDITNNIIEGE